MEQSPKEFKLETLEETLNRQKRLRIIFLIKGMINFMLGGGLYYVLEYQPQLLKLSNLNELMLVSFVIIGLAMLCIIMAACWPKIEYVPALSDYAATKKFLRKIMGLVCLMAGCVVALFFVVGGINLNFMVAGLIVLAGIGGMCVLFRNVNKQKEEKYQEFLQTSNQPN